MKSASFKFRDIRDRLGKNRAIFSGALTEEIARFAEGFYLKASYGMRAVRDNKDFDVNMRYVTEYLLFCLFAPSFGLMYFLEHFDLILFGLMKAIGASGSS